MKNNIFSAVAIASILTFNVFLAGCNSNTSTKTTTKSESLTTKKLELLSGKPNIIFVTSEHCGSCIEMKEVMKNRDISALLENNFKLVFLDINNINLLPSNLEKPIGTPTLYFVDASGAELLEPQMGVANPQEFVSKLKNASKIYNDKFPTK